MKDRENENMEIAEFRRTGKDRENTNLEIAGIRRMS